MLCYHDGMKILEETIEDAAAAELFHLYYPEQKVCMFDIETTGLSAARSFIYLIGVNLLQNGKWTIRQYFNEDGKSEAELLEAFQKEICDADLLVHFNGETFDIPFITRRQNFLRSETGRHIPNHFPEKQSVDLMKIIRPYKTLLGLPNIRQKTIEQYLGIQRIDQWNGGELIHVYFDYLSRRNTESEKMVLQHNRDDMAGMIILARILPIGKAAEGFFTYQTCRMEDRQDLRLILSARLAAAVPKKIESSVNGMDLFMEHSTLSLSIPVTTGVLSYPLIPGDRKSPLQNKESFYLICPGAPDSFSRLLPYYQPWNQPGNPKFFYLELNDAFLGNREYLQKYMQLLCQWIMKKKK